MDAVRESGEEIIIFEGILGLIQLSSLGEHIIKALANKNVINCIQNNLLESNEFIIHSSLELFVNITSFDPILQEKLIKAEYPHLVQILFALFGKYYEEVLDKKNQEKASSPYINKENILKTFFVIFALCSNFKGFKKIMVQKQLYEFDYVKKILVRLLERNAKNELASIVKNVVYSWKNSKKRGVKLLELLQKEKHILENLDIPMDLKK